MTIYNYQLLDNISSFFNIFSHNTKQWKMYFWDKHKLKSYYFLLVVFSERSCFKIEKYAIMAVIYSVYFDVFLKTFFTPLKVLIPKSIFLWHIVTIFCFLQSLKHYMLHTHNSALQAGCIHKETVWSLDILKEMFRSHTVIQFFWCCDMNCITCPIARFLRRKNGL